MCPTSLQRCHWVQKTIWCWSTPPFNSRILPPTRRIWSLLTPSGAHYVSGYTPRTARSTALSPSSLTHPSKVVLASLCHVHCACASQWLMNHLEFLHGTLFLQGPALDQWWANTVEMWTFLIGQKRAHLRYGRCTTTMCWSSTLLQQMRMNAIG